MSAKLIFVAVSAAQLLSAVMAGVALGGTPNSPWGECRTFDHKYSIEAQDCINGLAVKVEVNEGDNNVSTYTNSNCKCTFSKEDRTGHVTVSSAFYTSINDLRSAADRGCSDYTYIDQTDISRNMATWYCYGK
ncbi:hypothetical protein INT47_011649 [Mucor saturninus]|uniref:Uncharacterized protein n=1 Tax=Mucor saturninus TaxID=64648 RepID=A0A8H7R6S0_9FUNG|nr:hypothetical protein INT47_011649 [Mucor saturninus]